MTTGYDYFLPRRFVQIVISIIVTSVFALQEGEKIYMNQFALHIDHDDHTNIADSIANKHGFINLGKGSEWTGTYRNAVPIGNLKGFYLFEHNHVSKRAADPSHEHHEKLDTEPRVSWVQQQAVLKRTKRDLMYNDFGANAGRVGYSANFGSAFRPSYSGDFPDPLYGKQWYLHQGAVDGWDMNVLGAWKKGYSGYGVVVSILDDGIQTNHPDLARNYDPNASTDINGNDDDPMPQDNGDNKHGTRCAGEVAAVAFNDVCGVGVAFNASIGGVRMLDGTVNDAVEAKALSLNRDHIDIYSASWGPEDDGKTVDGPGPMARRAFIDGVTQGRNYKGSIFVWASGNGGRHVDNCNCDGYTNSIFTLSISSVTQRGLKPWYLEECSSTLATTYSSGTPAHDKNIVTVDMDPTFHPDTMCTQDHTGTSASAPIAAAICALALEANPNLTWRDMQYLVVLTSRPEPLMREEGWQVNGVNRKVSHKFGYGLMDATAMVNLAEQWMPVPNQHICETLEDSIQRPISKEFGEKLEIYMNTDACWNTPNVVNYLEHVQCRMTLRFNPRGNLKIILESPSGTKSVLLSPRPKDIYQTDFQDWPFLSVHFWGERAAGQWKLTILNAGSMNSPEPGILKKWSLVFHGTEQHPIHLRSHPSSGGYQFQASGRIPGSATVIQIREDAQSEDCHRECRGGCYGNGAEHCKECRHFKTDGELKMCVKTCSDGQFADKNNTCKLCHSSCKTCVNSTSSGCLSCAEGMFVEGKNQCEKTCPENYFARESDKMCLACSYMCASCFGEADNCTACRKGLVAFGNKCMAACPKNMYEGPNHRCLDCHVTCDTCMGPLDNECVTCPSHLVHWNGTCIESCPSGNFVHEQTNECYICDATCVTCNASHCLTCRPGWALSDDSGGRCQLKNECAKGYFVKNGNCVPCHGSCDSCEGSAYSQCLTCSPQLILFKNICVTKCPPNTVFVESRGCLPCHETCAACDGLKANHCTACKHGLVLRNHTCSTVCGERMYASKKMCLSCHLSCLTCSGPADEDCLTCPPGLQLGNGRCQESCPIGSFPRNNSCHPCHHTCLSCTGDDLHSCTSCQNNFILDNGLCMECQQGLYYDIVTQQCKPCDPSCTTCNGPDPFSCLSCTQPTKHDPVNHRCVSCCTAENLDNCCICDHRTDMCISIVSTDSRRIVVIDGTLKTTDEIHGFSYGTFGIVALLTCSVVIALFLAAFKLSQFRSKHGCCWSKGYQRLPVRSETKIEQLMDFAQDDFWDDNEHIRT